VMHRTTDDTQARRWIATGSAKARTVRWRGLCGLALAVALMLGCSEDSSSPPSQSAPQAAPKPPTTPPAAEPEPLDPVALVQRGKVVYASNCTACHNPDPSLDGALGPAVTGSTHDLLEKRVLHGTYPDGYEPKRTSRVMIALPHLEPDIAALTAYLNQ
jgi:mono/diheme cytochrome c family protein